MRNVIVRLSQTDAIAYFCLIFRACVNIVLNGNESFKKLY